MRFSLTLMLGLGFCWLGFSPPQAWANSDYCVAQNPMYRLVSECEKPVHPNWMGGTVATMAILPGQSNRPNYCFNILSHIVKTPEGYRITALQETPSATPGGQAEVRVHFYTVPETSKPVCLEGLKGNPYFSAANQAAGRGAGPVTEGNWKEPKKVAIDFGNGRTPPKLVYTNSCSSIKKGSTSPYPSAPLTQVMDQAYGRSLFTMAHALCKPRPDSGYNANDFRSFNSCYAAYMKFMADVGVEEPFDRGEQGADNKSFMDHAVVRDPKWCSMKGIPEPSHRSIEEIIQESHDAVTEKDN